MRTAAYHRDRAPARRALVPYQLDLPHVPFLVTRIRSGGRPNYQVGTALTRLRHQYDLPEVLPGFEDAVGFSNSRQRQHGVDHRYQRTGEDQAHHHQEVGDASHWGTEDAAVPLIDLPDVDVGPLPAGGPADGHASAGPEAAHGFRPGGGTHRIDCDMYAGSGDLPDLRAELRMSQAVDRHCTELRSFRRLTGAAVPTPPEAPTTSRSSPARSRAAVISPRHAVVKHTGAAAACSRETSSGTRSKFAAGTTVYSAIPPGMCSP